MQLCMPKAETMAGQVLTCKKAVFCAIMAISGCSSSKTQLPPIAVSPAASTAEPGSRLESLPAEIPAKASTAPSIHPSLLVNSDDAARAQSLVKKATEAYHHGDYDSAENSLKEAITIYPFLAEANIVMGKVLLVRASVARDPSLMKDARLMFEMALQLDPSAKEPQRLMDLFRAYRDE